MRPGISIDEFEDFRVNVGDAPRTRDAMIIDPSGGCTGRVDHFMLTSIGAIVRAYVRQFVRREGQIGRHVVRVEYGSLIGPASRTVEVAITTSLPATRCVERNRR